MVIEKKRHLLAVLTQLTDSEELREYESSFLKKYAKAMTNRQNFYINRQKAENGSGCDSLYKLLHRTKN